MITSAPVIDDQKVAIVKISRFVYVCIIVVCACVSSIPLVLFVVENINRTSRRLN